MRQKTKSKIILLGLSLLPAISVFPLSVKSTDRISFLRARTTQMRPPAQCIPQTKLSESLATLRSTLSDDDLFETKRLLLKNAKSSQDCRSQVIQALMTAMAKPGRDNGFGGVDDETYALWRNGAALLRELQATEALDLLIANFGLTDGFSTTLGNYPALDPIIGMGQLSIPKLEEVLSKDSKPFKRKLAVFCLASIGGTKARNVLAKALPGETDPCVKKFISVSLEIFNNKTRPNQIIGEENARWYSYIYCH
jgi:hypothetical protein